MAIKTVIFDADHTLYTPHSEKAYDAKFEFLSEATGKKKAALRRSWERLVEQKMQTRDPGEWERKRMIKETLKDVGASLDERVIDEAYTLFWETVVDNVEHPDGVGTMLRNLQNNGFRIALATDEFPEPVRMKLGAVLRTQDIESFFDVVVTCRDVGKQKPSQQYYELIVEETGVLPDECMVVGDSWIRDLQPAKKLGMTTVLVGESDPEGEPDHQIDRVTQVPDILEQVKPHGT